MNSIFLGPRADALAGPLPDGRTWGTDRCTDRGAGQLALAVGEQPVRWEDSGLPWPALLGSVRAGFPSPAEDLGEQTVDLTRELITHPQATYLVRARGHSMTGVGIFDRDLLVVNRALTPQRNQVVLAVLDGEFTVKTLVQHQGRVALRAANPGYPVILPKDAQTLEIWGVVTAAIKQFN
jgi:DNA polymerase V